MKKDQFIIACLDSAADAAAVLPYARHCAQRLHKGLLLLNVSKEGDNDWLKDFGLPYIGLKGDWKTAVDGLPTRLGGVLAIVAVDPAAPRRQLAHPTTLLATFSDCKIAYLVVPAAHAALPTPHWPETAALTLDHRRESKEKLIWSSYFPRFFDSRLQVLIPDYRDAGLREKISNNIQFLKKIYKSLNIEYTLSSFHSSLSTTHSLDRQALKHGGFDLLVAMTTDPRDRYLGDWLLGAPECRLLAHAGGIPLLFLNQRDDLYVLCD